MSSDAFLGMSDEDFLNANPADMEAEDATVEEEVAEEEEVVEDDGAEAVAESDESSEEEEEEDLAPEAEDESVEEDVPTEDDDSEGESEDEDKSEEEEEPADDVTKFESFFKEVTKEFKANGKMMKVDSPDDIVRLMQMGANYNRKMAALKPSLKMMKMLEKAELLDEKKLSYLIDLERKDPKAITKLLADSNVDPMELNLEEAGDYKESNHSIDEREIALDDVIEEIRETESFSKTINLVSKEWDDFSKQAVANEPQLLQVLNDHMASGIYDLISTEIEQERMLGRLTGKSDIEAYQFVGDALNARGAFDQFSSQESERKPVASASPKAKADDTKRRNKRRAASPAKPSAPATQKDDFNPLGMSDDEFLKQADPKFL